VLSDHRYFDPYPPKKDFAIELYYLVKNAPIISPHGHVNPALFSLPDYHFPNPSALLIQSDHYILRMLYSQGIPYDTLLSPKDPYKVWETFCGNFHLFRGTPSGMWISHELEMVFGITEKLSLQTSKKIYQQIEANLFTEDFTPRKLFTRFNIKVLATTDAAADPLHHHQAIRQSGWEGQIIPTFRPDELMDLQSINWLEKINELSALSGVTIHRFPDFIHALEQRREVFKTMGAKAIDVGVFSPRTNKLSALEVDRIFERALKGRATSQDGDQFTAHMLYEMARMCCEDGLVMQIHPGVFRNHNPGVYQRFGADRGFDIPVRTEFTQNLHPMLADFGNHRNFHLILFTLDESAYSRELAPLAGAYPSVKLGPPWWFLDSWNGMQRYFKRVMETAGLHNTAGFNDDTRAFLSIPARHDVWRRASADWLADVWIRGLVDESEAREMIWELAIGLSRKAYKLS
jgi:glucuronate isomerase